MGGVREGTIVGTVVQNPFEWGYQGMKLMAKYLEGDKSGIPANGLIIVPGQGDRPVERRCLREGVEGAYRRLSLRREPAGRLPSISRSLR